MPMYNLIEYSDAYLKTFGSLWQYYGDETSTDNNNNITDFPANNNNSNSLKLKQQIKGQKRGIVGAGGGSGTVCARHLKHTRISGE